MVSYLMVGHAGVATSRTMAKLKGGRYSSICIIFGRKKYVELASVFIHAVGMAEVCVFLSPKFRVDLERDVRNIKFVMRYKILYEKYLCQIYSVMKFYFVWFFLY